MTEAVRPERLEQPRFVTGSTLRHVTVMTATASIGLIAIFSVDFLSLLYISWLGDPRLTAAVGFATIVSFMMISINVGLMIAVSALVSRALGSGNRPLARRLSASTMTHMVLMAGLITLLMMPLLPSLLALLGASDEVLPIARRFLWIVLPSNVLMAVGMGLSGLLRAVGDAKRGMYVTLAGGIVTAMLDPVLIFGLHLGIDGAALTTIASRLVFAFVGYHGVVKVHDLMARPRLDEVKADFRPMIGIAFPAVLTNVATPVAGAFIAGIIARFGNEAIAGAAIIDRLTPLAFGGLFALSGAVGPILGQNWGAKRFDRMRQTLRDSILFSAVYVGLVWLLLIALHGPLIAVFHARETTAQLVTFFCFFSGALWFFNGLLFVANASFNNLGFPLYSTAFNWGRATIGTMPFALLGAQWAGPQGALLGAGIGSILFGIGGIWAAFRTIGILKDRSEAVLP